MSSQLKKHVGKEVMISGWLHKVREMGGLTFLVLRDRHGLVQVFIDSKEEAEKLKGMQVGTVLKIAGLVKEEPRAALGVEIHKPQITVEVPVVFPSPIEPE